MDGSMFSLLLIILAWRKVGSFLPERYSQILDGVILL